MASKLFNQLSSKYSYFVQKPLLFRSLCRGQPITTDVLIINNKMSRQIRTLVSTNNKESIATIKELRLSFAQKRGFDYDDNKIISSNPKDLIKYLPKSQDELPTRSIADSFLETLIPLASDATLKHKYVTFLGHIRIGRLLEDMDIFAVMVAEKYISNPNVPEGVPPPQTLVTAFVDKIHFSGHAAPKSHEDIKMSGHVGWVGKSSLEIIVWLEQKQPGGGASWTRITTALFVIASRDPINLKAAVVNRLVPANEGEKAIIAGGESRKQDRIWARKQHVSRVIPDQDEQKLIHDLYLRTKLENDSSLKNKELPSGNCLWMDGCTVSNIILSHPENRNIHNTVFGGFIMHQATELSWVLGYKFSKYRPVLKSISDINFNKPIAVNSLMQMYAYVVFTQMQFFQIAVYVETFNPSTGKNDTTNTFNFTYEVPDFVKEVIPNSYHEAMMYIDGRRHFLDVINCDTNTNIKLLTENEILNYRNSNSKL